MFKGNLANVKENRETRADVKKRRVGRKMQSVPPEREKVNGGQNGPKGRGGGSATSKI